jgi:hypothetical protein
MTGQSDSAWKTVQQRGAQVSIAFPIEMNMRHGIPPIIKMQQRPAAGTPGRTSAEEGLERRAPARAADCGAHPFAIRHHPDLGPARQ